MQLSTFAAGNLWADLTSEAFEDLGHREQVTAILPLAGSADWGLGRPLDLEEHLLAPVFESAVRRMADPARFLVLPPQRFLHAPYDHAFFGLDPDDVEDQIREIARSVKASGLGRLLLFNANPWNEELIEGLALDLRMELGLSTFCLNLAALGLDLHPGRSVTRADVQCVASAVFGTEAREPDRPTCETLTWFRPGRFDQPPPLQTKRPFEEARARGLERIEFAADRMARVLGEIAAFPDRPEPAPTGSAVNADQSTARRPDYPIYRSRYLPAFTRRAIEHLPGKQAAVVVIPAGAIEQHGPHLPVGTDAMLSQAWLESALQHLPARAPVYVGPALPVGKSSEHLAFPGTLTLSGRLLRHNLLAIAEQLKSWGFQTLAVLNAHGGNSASLSVALREVQTRLGLQAGLLRPSLVLSASDRENAWGIHAGEVETSLMLGIDPERVDMDKARSEFPIQADDPGELRPFKGTATWAWTSRDLSRSGVMGDATRATVEKGHAWLEQGGRDLAEDLQNLVE